jgi:hypothetical protein
MPKRQTNSKTETSSEDREFNCSANETVWVLAMEAFELEGPTTTALVVWLTGLLESAGVKTTGVEGCEIDPAGAQMKCAIKGHPFSIHVIPSASHRGKRQTTPS